MIYIPSIQKKPEQLGQKQITSTEIKRDEYNNENNNPSRSNSLLTNRPGYLFKLNLYFIKKISGFCEHDTHLIA
jgi:hypothetical protein